MISEGVVAFSGFQIKILAERMLSSGKLKLAGIFRLK